MSELESTQSWEQARKIVANIGSLPSTFFSCIRFLRTDFEQHGNELSNTSRIAFATLIRSASFKSPLYYCALTFRPDKISNLSYISPSALIAAFKPDELSVVIAMLYLCRKVKRFCDPEEWKFVSENLVAQADIGGAVGQFIPAIGLANGILVGAIRNLASAMFCPIDKKQFGNYRRLMKRRGISFDQQEELNLWGCTHSQIASLMAQPLGLGPNLGNAIGRGLSALNTVSDGGIKDAIAFQMAAEWIDSLHHTGKAPKVVNDARFYPLVEDQDALLDLAQEVRQKGTFYGWLGRGKADISPETTPALFEKAPPSAKPSEAAPLPDEIAGEITKDIQELEAEDS